MINGDNVANLLAMLAIKTRKAIAVGSVPLNLSVVVLD